ncbi:hypothetical protein H2248_004330 [Termitomyces sp. 'cryptogamus']|nr:hypothetical protein H2248_004330 [Termitomyces sp. 'cryptogamus']
MRSIAGLRMQLGLGQHPCTEREDLGDMPRRSKEIMRIETIVVVNFVQLGSWRSPFPALRPSIHDCMALPTPIVAQYLLQIDYRTRSTTEH